MNTETEQSQETSRQQVPLKPIVMCTFSQGVYEDGIVILRDGEMMTIEEIILELRTLTADANRYQFLKNADLDSINKGGIFVGKTPDNVVINGADLDREIDAQRYSDELTKEAQKQGFYDT